MSTEMHNMTVFRRLTRNSIFSLSTLEFTCQLLLNHNKIWIGMAPCLTPRP